MPLQRTFLLSEGRAAVRLFVLLGALIVVLAVGGTAGLLLTGAHALDSFETRRSLDILAPLTPRRLSRVANDVDVFMKLGNVDKALGLEGDAAAGAKPDGWFIKTREQDWTLVVDGRGQAIRSWFSQTPHPAPSIPELVTGAAPLIDRARQADGSVHTASGLVMIGGTPYLVASRRLSPPVAPGVKDAPGPLILVTGQRADHEALEIAARMGVSGARIVTQAPPDFVGAPLYDVNHRVVAQLAAPHRHPGAAALRDAALPLTVGFLLFLILAAGVGWQIVRVMRRLMSYEKAYGQALDDLSDARDRAEAANVAKSLFLANMSHEIRTPLNGVLGMAQVLARSDLAPSDREKLQLIQTSGENLLCLLNDLLDLSKIEAGYMTIDLHEFDMEEVVRSATQPFAEIAAQKDLKFVVDLGPDVSGVWRGDGGRLRQVLANLASNAVKFTHQGEVRVTLRRSPDGIACAVADTGIGIPKDRLSLLFQRFSQVDPTATRKAGGSGLGLAICRDLVELLGGQVSVTSEEGEGTTFNFQIPLTFVEAPQPADIGEVETGDFGPIRILAAEDNHVNQIILGAILEPIGAELSLVADGQAALELFQREAFDLVLMDIQMPVMNGIEATMAIRRFEAETGRWRTPIVALSANVMHHQLQEYLAAGMDGLIAKPIEMRELIGGVRKALCPDVTPGEALAAAG